MASLFSSSSRLLRQGHLPRPRSLRSALPATHLRYVQSQDKSTQAAQPSSCCSKSKKPTPPTAFSREFWSSPPTWRRSGINTFRCFVGCTSGDFSAMWYLQAFHPDMGMESVMAISMASGLSTSLLLETVLLKFGRDRLPWLAAAKTAAGMSMISMITMELAENMVDYHLTGGIVQLDDPKFWVAAFVSMAAGFLAPLPYNYHRLRKFGKACH